MGWGESYGAGGGRYVVGRSYRNPRGLYGVGVGVTEGVIGSYGAGGGRYGVGGGRYGVGRSYRNPMGILWGRGILWEPYGGLWGGGG